MDNDNMDDLWQEYVEMYNRTVRTACEGLAALPSNSEFVIGLLKAIAGLLEATVCKLESVSTYLREKLQRGAKLDRGYLVKAAARLRNNIIFRDGAISQAVGELVVVLNCIRRAVTFDEGVIEALKAAVDSFDQVLEARKPYWSSSQD